MPTQQPPADAPEGGEGPRDQERAARRKVADRGDLEQVRARRVERADLVRDILERKQHDDEPEPQAEEPIEIPRLSDDAEFAELLDARERDAADLGVDGPSASGDAGEESDVLATSAGDADNAQAEDAHPASVSKSDDEGEPLSEWFSDGLESEPVAEHPADAAASRTAPEQTADAAATEHPADAAATEHPADAAASLKAPEGPATTTPATTTPATSVPTTTATAASTPPAMPPGQTSISTADPFASADSVVPEALVLLRTWREAEIAARDARERELQDATPRQRAKLDTRTELERALEAEDGADFLRHFVDDVLRPDDRLAAGFGMSDLAQRIPETLTTKQQRKLRLGAFAGPGAPVFAAPFLRRKGGGFFAGELTLGTPDALHEVAAAAATRGAIVRVRPLADRILGRTAELAMQERILTLIGDPAVSEVELTVADLDASTNLWDFDGIADRAAARFARLLLEAEGTTPTMLQLRATGSRDIELTAETFMRALDAHGLEHAAASLALPAEFPDSATLLRRVTGWAHLRHEDGGGPVQIAVTREGDALVERADAVLRGWRIANYPAIDDVDANAMRLIDQVLESEHRDVLSLEVESSVPIDAAFALALAAARGRGPVSVVVPQGANPAIIERMREAGAAVRLRVPLLPGMELRPGATYLLHRIDELDAARVDDDPDAVASDGLARQDDRLLAAIARMQQVPAGPVRSQTRVDPEDAPGLTAGIELELFPEGQFEDEPEPPRIVEERERTQHFGAGNTTILGRRGGPLEQTPAPKEQPSPQPTGPVDPSDTGASPRLTEVVLGLRRGRILRNTFRNQPDSDPTLASVREWAQRIRRRATRSSLGVEEAASHLIGSLDDVSAILDRGHDAGLQWRERTGWERAAQLEKIAKAIDTNRARLIEVAMSETLMTFADLDNDVNHVVDLANFNAHLARQLDRVQGGRFEPVRLSIAVPGWVPPVSGSAAPILSGLAAGSAVVLKPSPRTQRTAAILARVLWAAGVPDDLLQVAACDERTLSDEQLGRELITDRRVDRVLFHGYYTTAAKMLEWRPDLPLIGFTGGKASVIITPSADYDQAAHDIAVALSTTSGQLPTRPSAAILVGSVGRAERFAEQLVDAVASRRIGFPSDPSVDAGPLAQPASTRQEEMLTALGEHERWLLEPRKLDDTGRLWTPGIRTGVTAEAATAMGEVAAPVLNIVHARTLDEAIRIQNAMDVGLVAGLYSLDRAEIAQWVQGVEAGNLYVNRGIVQHRVQRQPFGGWKRSMIGTKLKSGGPNNLIHLGEWRDQDAEGSQTLHLRGLDTEAARIIEAMQSSLDYERFERVRRTALSCQIAWNEEFGEVVDVTNLPVERNLFRYRPAPVLIRAAEDADVAEFAQVLVAAVIARAKPKISVATPLPQAVLTELARLEFPVTVESDATFLRRLADEGLRSVPRLRLIGGSRRAVYEAVPNRIEIAVFSNDVTQAGRVEMLPFLREQSISLRAERRGRRDTRVDHLFPHETVADPTDPVLG